MADRNTNTARNFALDAQRAANRHYQTMYRKNHPERIQANTLRHYARKLAAAGYTVLEPTNAAESRMAL